MLKKIIIALPLLIVIIVYGCTASSYGASITGQAVVSDTGTNRGNLAPDFTVTTTDGKTVRLSELTNDKPTVLYFFATWCPNCALDLAAVRDVYPEYFDKVNFLAVDLDLKESESQIESYKQRMNLPNIDFAAGNKDILADYNIVYTTTKFFLGKDGNILNKGVGGVDENTWHQIFKSMSQ